MLMTSNKFLCFSGGFQVFAFNKSEGESNVIIDFRSLKL